MRSAHWPACAAAVAAAAALVLAEAPRAQAPPAAGAARLGAGSLAPGETDSVAFPALAGDFLWLTVDSTAPLDLAVAGPGGGPGAASHGPRQLAFLAAGDGEHRLSITPLGATHEVRWAAELRLRRPGRAGDAKRIQAIGLFADADLAMERRTAAGYAAALPLLALALPLFEQTAELAEAARVHNRMGLSLSNLDRLPEAAAEFERALGGARLARDEELLGHALANLAAAYRRGGRLSEALALHREVLRHRRSPENLSNAALASCDAGRAEEGLALLAEALPLAQAADRGAGGGRLEPLALLNRGYCQRLAGEFPESAASYEAAQALAAERGVSDLALVAASNRAVVHRLRGEYQRAISLLLEAARQAAASVPNQRTAVLYNLGTAYRDLGRDDRARAAWQEALAATADPLRAAELIRNLGWLDLDAGDPQAARTRFAAALARAGELASPRARADALHALAIADLALGDVAAARGELEDALTAASAAAEPVRQAEVLLGLGEWARRAGDPAAALASFERARQLAARLGEPARVAAALDGLAAAHLAAGDTAAAEPLLVAALAAVEDLRGELADPDLRATFLARRRAPSERYLGLLLAARPPRAAQALAVAERCRARALAERLHERHLLPEIPAELAREERSLAARLAAVQRQMRALAATSGAADSAAVAGELPAQLAQIEAARERLRQRIREVLPRYADLTHPPPLAGEDIPPLLAPGTALLEYFVGEEASYLFCVRREGVAAHRIAAGAASLGRQVERLRAALVGRDARSFAGYRAIARELYERLVAPADGSLAGIDRLLIVADGPLHYLPFEALLASPAAPAAGPSELPYLLRRFTVGYAPSASLLARLGGAPGDRGAGFVAFADPAFGGAAAADGPWSFPALPETAREAEGIADLFPPGQAVVFRGERASESTAKTSPEVAAARWLHFATHAQLEESRPDYQGLVLAAEAAGEDGLLQVHEIFGLNLSADLVVLSACRTGLGRLVSGEGLVGMAQAFFYAGARRLLVSLWAVPDRSTADMMLAFYRRLGGDAGAPMPPEAALRAAKLALIEGGPWSHPYYWAPFVLAGGLPEAAAPGNDALTAAPDPAVRRPDGASQGGP